MNSRDSVRTSPPLSPFNAQKQQSWSLIFSPPKENTLEFWIYRRLPWRTSLWTMWTDWSLLQVIHFPFTGTHSGQRNRQDFRLYPRPDAEQVLLPVDLEWLLIVAVHQPYVILYQCTGWLLEKACFSSLFCERVQHVGRLCPPHVHCHRCLCSWHSVCRCCGDRGGSHTITYSSAKTHNCRRLDCAFFFVLLFLSVKP
jgi:hypothetical protein